MNEIILSKITKFLKLEDCPETTIRKYSALAGYVLYTNPDIINLIVSKMKKNIESWAIEKSHVYKDYSFDKIYSRENLLDNSLWYIDNKNIEFLDCNTSGSTTGDRFSYRITKKYHNFLEDNNQYGMILKEFGLPKIDLKILTLMNMAGNPTIENDQFGITHFGPSKHAYHGHRSRTSIRHFVKFDNYLDDLNKWHQNLIDYIADKDLDIILSNGPIINGLKNYLQKNNIKIKLCKLLSHTSQFPIKEDFKFLKENNYIDNYCDSMRCWDGGATFFTCKYNTYHLMDNLSYCFEKDNKLISTDYFSLSAPFINYWNGDLCEIAENYKKCECGRWYRPFKMLQNRPFAVKGPSKLTEIKSKISSLGFKTKIKQVHFLEENINLITSLELTQEERKTVDDILKDYIVKYTCY